MFASVARDVGIASAIDYASRRGFTVSPNIIHLFDAEIRQLVDEVETQQVGSKRDLLVLLPSLAVHASFSYLAQSD